MVDPRQEPEGRELPSSRSGVLQSPNSPDFKHSRCVGLPVSREAAVKSTWQKVTKEKVASRVEKKHGRERQAQGRQLQRRGVEEEGRVG